MTSVLINSDSEIHDDGIAAEADTGSAEAVLLQLLSGYRIPSCLLEIGKLGIPDLLVDGPRSVDELARERQLDPDALYRVLRLLASNGVFNEVSPRTFRQTPVSDTLRLLRVLRLNLELPRVLETGRSGIELAASHLHLAASHLHTSTSTRPRAPSSTALRGRASQAPRTRLLAVTTGRA